MNKLIIILAFIVCIIFSLAAGCAIAKSSYNSEIAQLQQKNSTAIAQLQQKNSTAIAQAQADYQNKLAQARTQYDIALSQAQSQDADNTLKRMQTFIQNACTSNVYGYTEIKIYQNYDGSMTYACNS